MTRSILLTLSAAAFMLSPHMAIAAGGAQKPAAATQAPVKPATGQPSAAAPKKETAPILRAQLKAKQYAMLAAGLAGEIASLPAREGMRIDKGEVIASLDCSTQEAARTVAQAKLSSANAKKETSLRLSQLQSISDLDVKLSKSEADVAAGELQAINATLKKCIIHAPFAGTITKQAVQAHQFVREGEPIVELMSSDDLEIEMILPSQWLAWLKPDTGFTMKIIETGETISAKVSSIGGKIDPISQTVRVLGVPVGGTRLLPGMSGTLSFDIPAS